MEPAQTGSPQPGVEAAYPLLGFGLAIIAAGWLWVRAGGRVNGWFVGAAMAAGAATAARLRSAGPVRDRTWVGLLVPGASIVALVWDAARAPAGHFIVAAGALSVTLGVRVWVSATRAAT